MAILPRIRKRIAANPPLRTPDGSAFEKCHFCGGFYHIALADMHECKFKGGHQSCKRLKVSEQPRSAFRIFMDLYTNRYKTKKPIENDREGFQIWKSMSKEERRPFEDEAERVNIAYQEVMTDEIDESQEEDEEADSAEVGKFDPECKGKWYDESESESNLSWYPSWSSDSSWYHLQIC